MGDATTCEMQMKNAARETGLPQAAAASGADGAIMGSVAEGQKRWGGKRSAVEVSVSPWALYTFSAVRGQARGQVGIVAAAGEPNIGGTSSETLEFALGMFLLARNGTGDFFGYNHGGRKPPWSHWPRWADADTSWAEARHRLYKFTIRI